MDLFRHAVQKDTSFFPLAERLRPKTFDEFIGIHEIKGFAGPLQKLLASGHLQNLILWGPPGTGKTTFAELLKTKVDAEMISLNAVSSGAKELRTVGEQASRRRIETRKKTIVFVDEIHRFNKSQQDVLLPFIERGDFFLIGATTENPSYELNAALLSRCRLLIFSRFSRENLERLMERAFLAEKMNTEEVLGPEAKDHLFQLADGDGRRLLNLLEPIFILYRNDRSEMTWPLTPEQVEELSGQKAIYFDKKGDQHYDVISAFIKSIRGSDPDAGLYYLARMLEGGENPVFIARRLVILASEDISNADPRALPLAVAGLQAVELIGLPEAAISLAQVVTYLASAPKSNRSYIALHKAQEEVRQTGQLPVPLALRSGKGKILQDIGYGKDYKYSHEGPKGYVAQDFFPEDVRERTYYEPTDHGFEKNIRQYLQWLKS